MLALAHADDHAGLQSRRVLNPYFAPHGVARLRPRAQELAAWRLDEAIEMGEADLVESVLEGIPDYGVVDVDRFRPAPGNVVMNTVVSMPVTFTPARRR